MINKRKYSLMEISEMSMKDICTKVFTFDRKNLGQKMKDKLKGGDLDFDKVVKNLKCMRGIDENFIPQFKYF
jgi:hypothetical protein